MHIYCNSCKDFSHDSFSDAIGYPELILVFHDGIGVF